MGVHVSIDPKLGEIGTRRIPSVTLAGDFHALDIGPAAVIFVCNRATLDALQAALDEIRADMDAAEEPAGDNPWNYGDAGAGVGGNP